MIERNPHFDSVNLAQIERLGKSRMGQMAARADIIRAIHAMPADEAYRLITQELLPDVVRRRMIEAHDRVVDGVPV
jgi:hypothetical protein